MINREKIFLNDNATEHTAGIIHCCSVNSFYKNTTQGDHAGSVLTVATSWIYQTMHVLMPCMITLFILLSTGCGMQARKAMLWPKFQGPFPFKDRTLREIGVFKIESKFQIYQCINDLAFQLYRSTNSTLLKQGESKTGAELTVLKLLDNDSDGNADVFLQMPQGAQHTLDFSYIFDLDNDGNIDYCVFNGGPHLTKDKEFIWMNYHYIDSNSDGKVDIIVYNVDLDGDKFLDKDVTAWLSDSDFDGLIDHSEYIGKNFNRQIEEVADTIVIKTATGETRLRKQDTKSILAGLSAVLTDINELIH